MRVLLAAVSMALGAAAPADAAAVRILSAAPAGSAVAGQPVEIVIRARAAGAAVDGASLTWPDLQGSLGAAGCGSGRGAGAVRRFALPYVPAWAGTHVLTASVVAGACTARPVRAWRAVMLDVAPAAPDAAAAASGGATAPGRANAPGGATAPGADCTGAGDLPLPRSMRAARLAVVCVLNRERRARGLRPLRTDQALRRRASLRAHGRGRPAAGEHRALATVSSAAPAWVAATWLASDANRPGLLSPRARRIGVSVVALPIGPLRRPGARHVVLVR